MTRSNSLQIFVFLTILTFPFKSKAITHKTTHQTLQIFDLILAGGGLATCSSMAVKKCRKNVFSEQALEQIKYQFSNVRQETFRGSYFYSNLDNKQKVNIDSLIKQIHSQNGDDIISKGDIKATFKIGKLRDVYYNLPDASYYALLDFFEFRQLTDKGNRKKEQTALQQNENQGSAEVYQAFYQQAKIRADYKNKVKPTILIVTASARDPFESADFYQSVFSSFDAAAEWLPLDMSLQASLENAKVSCNSLEQIRNDNHLFDRARIYPDRVAQQAHFCRNPDKLLKLISNADGIFFNGGDQSKTIAALTDSKGNPNQFLLEITAQMANKQLVVGGTSAGTAVQAGGRFNNEDIVMLTNGSPKYALSHGAVAQMPPSARCSESSNTDQNCNKSNRPSSALTYRNQGGTALFRLGLLDTHFSERDREVRLATFAHQSKARFAFGVDEASALLVNHEKNGDVSMAVVGENGVFIVDVEDHQFQLKKPGQNYVSGVSHFVNAGDKIKFNKQANKLDIQFSTDSKRLKNKNAATYSTNNSGTWRSNIANNCGSERAIQWQQFDHVFVAKAAANTQFSLNPKKQCSYAELPFVVSQ